MSGAEPTIRPTSTAGPEIVPLTPGQIGPVAPLVARAFDTDPYFVWMEPDPATRRRFLTALFEALAWRSHLYAEALTTAGEPLGVSLWKGPDLHELSPEQSRRTGLDRVDRLLALSSRARFESAFARVDLLLDRLESGPRWYLGVLAVAPEAQGRGIGGALMRPILERADRERLPVTLETTKPANVELYRRYGFEVLASEPLPLDGPPFWILRRPPH